MAAAHTGAIERIAAAVVLVHHAMAAGKAVFGKVEGISLLLGKPVAQIFLLGCSKAPRVAAQCAQYSYILSCPPQKLSPSTKCMNFGKMPLFFSFQRKRDCSTSGACANLSPHVPVPPGSLA
jgi:hypothetical protein